MHFVKLLRMFLQMPAEDPWCRWNSKRKKTFSYRDTCQEYMTWPNGKEE